MWTEFFRFDVRFHFRQPLLWITTLLLATLAFLSASSESFRIGAAVGNAHLNSPFLIANELSIMSMIAMFLVTVFIAGALLRDNEVGIADLLFATPMRKPDYLSGRFLAGFAACLFIFAVITLAMMLGSRMPGIDPVRIGAFSFLPYAWSFLVFVIPNLLLVSALLMLLAATTRSMLLVYVGILVFTVLWSVAGLLTAGNANALSVLFDPFGIRALAHATRYFSIDQMNTALPELNGLLLWNRVMWVLIAVSMFAATIVLFKPQRAGTGKGPRRSTSRVSASVSTSASVDTPVATRIRPIAPSFGLFTHWMQCWHMLCFDAKWIIKSMPFLIMLILALANFFANTVMGGMRFDSTPYPLTRVELDELSGGFNIMLPFILIFYCGEFVFKARQVNIADISDAMPVPDWVPLLAKAAALMAIVLIFLIVGDVCAIAVQLYKGGVPIDGWLYLQGTLISTVTFGLMGLGMLAVQMLINHKYTGYFVSIVLMLSSMILDAAGLTSHLFIFASLPPLIYSDMNGYGHFLTAWSWFALYWGLFVAAALILAMTFSMRGRVQTWYVRWATGIARLRGPVGVALTVALTGFGASGAWIFYNTQVLNHFQSRSAQLDARADYEKRYRKYLEFPNPNIVSIQADVDIFPGERRVAIKGHYLLKNTGTAPIEVLHIQLDTEAQSSLTLPAHTVELDDQQSGFKIIHLKQALAVGDTMPFDFSVNVRNPGFADSGAPGNIHHNGTLFTSENYFPKFGYVQGNEIEDRGERRARGLGEPHGMPKLEDANARSGNYLKSSGFDTGLIDFDTTVSTSADQIAIAPGRLEKTWEQGGRRYFHYKMDSKILPFFSYQSARWETKTGYWKDVPIEVYFDAKHHYNVDSMISGVQQALDYYTQNFGPYQHKQVRILETPLYQTYARSFPLTIPFSESLGFINDLRDPNGVDHVFYVTAHELAHQWWGDQMIAANVQGSGMLTESLAEYSALMVLEKTFGAEKVRHVLRYDLDEYFSGRSKELVEELPLYRSENQVYIQYRKGSLIFYRLRNEIGEAALNRALKHFLDDCRYHTHPYPVSTELLKYIRAETPPEKQNLVTDMFERIVFYDNRVVEATTRKRPDGKWDVTMKLSLAKIEADGKGKERRRTYDEPVEIGVFARAAGAPEKDERVLYRAMHTLPDGESRLTITVDEEPFEVGVDPYHLMIERSASDTRKRVKLETGGN